MMLTLELQYTSVLIEGSLNNTLPPSFFFFFLLFSSSDPLVLPHRLTPGVARLGQAASLVPVLFLKINFYLVFDSFIGSYSGAVDHWTRMGGLALDIITTNKEPYFLYFSVTMVHAPFQDVSKKNSEPVTPSASIHDGMIRAMDKATTDIAHAIDSSNSADNTILHTHLHV